ncbi:MAG: response regulator transcription factor [Alteraurantiacibacter sp.]
MRKFVCIVAHGHALSLLGLSMIIERWQSDVEIVEASDFDKLREAFADNRPAILIIDNSLPGMFGISGLRDLMCRAIDTKICLLVETPTTELISRCIDVGIDGCVEKQHTKDDLPNALDALMADKLHLPRPTQVKSAVAQNDNIGVLTRQQRNVIQIMAKGKSNKEIARELGICEGTVKVHVNAAYRALGVHNRVSAVSKLQALAG